MMRPPSWAGTRVGVRGEVFPGAGRGVMSAACLKESGGPGSRSAFEGGNQISPYMAGMALVLFLFFLSLFLERSKQLWTWPPGCPHVPPPGVASGCSSQGFTPPHCELPEGRSLTVLPAPTPGDTGAW